jgi:hypothetical protein
MRVYLKISSNNTRDLRIEKQRVFSGLTTTIFSLLFQKDPSLTIKEQYSDRPWIVILTACDEVITILNHHPDVDKIVPITAKPMKAEEKKGKSS